MDLLHRASKRGSLLGYICIGLCLLVLVVRSFMGFDWTDESFYLSTVYRVLQGDDLLVTEWHPTQLFTVLTLPLMAAFRWLNQGLDGIVLLFRLCYVALSTMVAALFFRRFARRFNKLFVLMAALVLMTYVKSHQGTLSYNSISMLSFVGASSLLYAYIKSRRAIYGVLAGTVYSVATLCLPYLAVVFALAFVVALLMLVRRAWRAPAREALRFLLLMCLGIAPVLAAFLWYMLSVAAPGDMIRTLPYIFMDPAHDQLEQIGEAIDSLKNVVRRGRLTMVPLTLIPAYLAVKRLRGARVVSAERIALLAAAALLTLANLFWISTVYYVIPFVLLGWTCFLLCERRDMAMFCALDLGGMVLSLVYLFSSTTGLSAIAFGLVPCVLSGLLCAGRLAAELVAERPAVVASAMADGAGAALAVAPSGGWRARLPRAVRVCAALTVLVLCASMVAMSGYRRVMLVYRDGTLSKLTTRLTEGPAKGLFTQPKRAENYNALLRLTREYATGDGDLIIMPFVPWMYMSTTMRCGAPTTWRMLDNDPRFEPYYKHHPDKLPDVMLALNLALTEYESRPDDGNVTGAMFESGGYLAQYRDSTPFERITTDVADVYIREGYAGQP